VARQVEGELELLAADDITDVTWTAQLVRRTLGKWVGSETRLAGTGGASRGCSEPAPMSAAPESKVPEPV
jgi:hypothetical protein